jgi:hypothetical protein
VFVRVCSCIRVSCVCTCMGVFFLCADVHGCVCVCLCYREEMCYLVLDNRLIICSCLSLCSFVNEREPDQLGCVCQSVVPIQ